MHKRLLHSIVNIRVNHPTTKILIQKRQFQNPLLMKTLFSTGSNLVVHSDQLERNIVRPYLSNTSFWWSKRTSQMVHNRQTSCRPRRCTTLGQKLETMRNPSPKPRLDPSAMNSGRLHPVRPEKALAVAILVNPQGKIYINIYIYIYMYYCITVVPNIGNNRSRTNAAMPLTIHAISRQLSQKETAPIDDNIDKGRLHPVRPEKALAVAILVNPHLI